MFSRAWHLWVNRTERQLMASPIASKASPLKAERTYHTMAARLAIVGMKIDVRKVRIDLYLAK